ncbi:unnamed protein product [Eruca vesicaria subsp. sativa]|uniref:Cysteine-rich receptor-like protein kinase 10 n=1 Tax=Eruca vesicaria subsp. sativa TaxID=29727 RepID=A0ABC8KIV5_ERUVS|nr:unnamed protein product [Eruca vesicaria subsp. sativa]
MSSRASFILLFLFSFLTSFRATAVRPNFVHHDCRNTTRYSANSTYFTNLKTLWSSLSSTNASYSTGFQNASAGQARDMVTGLFLCRGDVLPDVCRDCVSFSVTDIVTRCPDQREAIIYYEECMLRYSDRNIFSNLTLTGDFLMYNANSITSVEETARFEKVVLTTIIEAAFEAANNSRYFCTRSVRTYQFQNLYNFQFQNIESQNLYVLVQCTPDLTRQDCLSCLELSIYKLNFERTGARLLLPSCNSRYELYQFYNESVVDTPLLPSLPPTPLVASTPPVSSAPRPSNGGNLNVLAIAVLAAIIMALLLFIAGYCFLAKRTKRASDSAPAFYGDDITTIDSLQLDYRTIEAATNDYSDNNKIGRGGFGEVYKGTFLNGTEVAVKRLSKLSGQGETEFKNEVIVVAKLQHRNLVRLVGFSLEREERILVYEYVPNKSLDYFLFDPTKKDQLCWTRRYKIIGGIVRGMLYLHQDSRLTIIHRDLKASNILLDADMNPKISDFGMARIFGMYQTQENTSRIVGTYGYMSPEYAMHGQFSMKSDVYSFGVLVLEIIIGRKNSSFYERDGAHNLVTYAWRLWTNKEELDLVDPVIVANCQKREVVRCIHIGLLCVQEDPAERPTFSTILLMLTSNNLILPVPQQPGFVIQTRPKADLPNSNQSTMTKCVIGSVSDASVTDLYPLYRSFSKPVMSSRASLIFLFIFFFLTSFRATAQDPTYVHHICSNTTTYTRNSTYSTNLRALLSSLSSNNSSYTTGFQTATSGQGADRVTGLFLCRGDFSPEVCQRCVAFVVNDTSTRCPNEREVVLYYDECIVRYSNRNILSTLDTNVGLILNNGQNITSNQKDQFRDLVLSTMNQAASEAAESSRKFDARRANWTRSQSLYGLVQCTPDLTGQDCLSCLQQGINQLPVDKIGGRFIVPSCNSRYEIYPFYNESAITTPPPPPVSVPPPPGGNSTVLVIAIVVPIIVVALLFIACYCFLAKRAKKTNGTSSAFDVKHLNVNSERDDITTAEPLQLDYRSIQTATNDFAECNKIGEGGFGEVYKGTLLDGTEVAVKRLSKSSGQGDAEFKNEVILVAKLLHRNLVRLLGFCLEGEERVLVYEYVPNESLDYFIFDPAKQSQLDWSRRYKIIGGIARGILYLHQDSRLTIIHRDLKASNILLDVNMNPKIADFGMARIFGMNQTEENTSRIVGTYGYMSPEYAMHGQYSMKSDVYSFGVLVLEIISGKKNSSFYQTDGAHDLVSYAWRLWSNGTPLELVDSTIVDNCQRNEVVRCVHISLLCVQEDPVERPPLSTIVLMLSSNTVTLPAPRQPGLFFQSRLGKNPLDSDKFTTTKSLLVSVDDASITDLNPR